MQHRKSAKKMSGTQKQRLAGILADLLSNGFSLKESLQFVAKADLFSEELVAIFQRNLISGKPLYRSFAQCGYTSQQITQVQLADMHGDLAATLRSMEKQIALMEKQKQNLVKAATYPGLLLLFLVGIFFAMRQILLPQLLASGLLEERHPGVIFLQGFPLILLGILGIFGGSYAFFRFRFRKRTYLARAVFWGELPVVRKFYRPYLSGYFALEWGKLFQEGLELQQVIYCMKKAKGKSVMRELALRMEKSMAKGQPLTEELEKYPFFTKEFTKIVQQGEAKGRLGRELLLYSELTWQYFFQQVEKMLTWIQPVIFLFVAVLIIMIYAALLLPIYSNIEGVL